MSCSPARVLFIICLPIAIFTATIGLAFNSLSLYKYDFRKNDISSVTGISMPELDNAARDIIRYWNSGEEWIDTVVTKDGQPFTLFNEREVVHFKDVKSLVRLAYAALAVTGLYCLGYAVFMLRRRKPGYKRELALAGLGGSLLSLVILAALGIAAAVDFNGFWWQFHLISFANDFWLLDPRTDYLIMMFPEPFWLDGVIIIAGVSAAVAVFIGGLAWSYLKRSRQPPG